MGTERVRKQSCGNLEQMQEGKTALIKKDGGEMLIAIELDKPLSEAQALVDDSDAFMLEITKTIQNKHAHPVVVSMLHPDVRDDLPPSECATASSEGQSSRTVTTSRTQPYISFAVNVGYPRLMVPRPAQAQPPCVLSN